MRIQINRLHYPVEVLGYGTRLGIWVQGCSIRCRGCVAADMWDPDPSKGMEIEDVIAAGRKIVAGGPLDGCTISGGEPFDQPCAVTALLHALRVWGRETAESFDILVYTGHSADRVSLEWPEARALCDGLIVGPYLADRPTEASLMGSANQQLVAVTPLGVQRYARRDAFSRQRRRIQVSVDGDRLLMIGIPGRGDLERCRSLVAEAGIELDNPSWLT